MKQRAETDIAVLVLFFNRPQMVRRLFQQIRLARPSRLLLYQDGPRTEADNEKILQCREIFADEHIDWQCTVHRNYQQVNMGCDPANYNSVKWAFSIYDKCVKLEDDDLPALSFFPFCKEMLDRYENDLRISMITGINYDEVSPDVPSDYFFSTAFSINGWASWRRVIDQWDATYSFLDDTYNMHQLSAFIRERRYQQDFIRQCQYHRRTGKAYYETIFHAAVFLQSGLSIVPRVNLISNAGASEEGTHYSGNNDVLPRAIRRIFTMPVHELRFPLRHPLRVIEDVEYKNRMFRIFAWGHPWIKVARSLEELWLNLRKGNLQRISTAAVKRIRIWCGHAKWE